MALASGVDDQLGVPGSRPEQVLGGQSAAAALVPDVAGALVDVPFLANVARAIEITDTNPYLELATFLAVHRDRVELAFRTLSYFDVAVLARRATAPALFSVGLSDTICPPSTVYAAFNHYAGVDRTITVWPFADHGGGYGSTPGIQLDRKSVV